MTWKRHAADNDYKVQVFAANMADINKILRMKKHSDFQKKLFKYFYHYLQIFNCKVVDQLLSLRGDSMNYKIELILDKNDKAPDVFYDSLY